MKAAVPLFAVSISLLAPRFAFAHCDTLDGPVVTAARKALETGQLAPVIAWVQPKDEAEVRTAFVKTMAVRKTGPEAKELADRYFFETLVRVHRAGEGAPFTGLKPAGGGQDPALVAADQAIATGKLEPLTKLLETAVKDGLGDRFARLRALAPPADDPAKGREWVAAYVAYVHYVTGLHQAAEGPAGEHAEASQAHAGAHVD